MKLYTYKGRVISEKLWVAIGMLILKYFYMLLVTLMLPENWELWSFSKNVDWIYSLRELIPFFLCLCIYMRTYRKGSTYSGIATMLFIVYFIPNNCGLSLSGFDLWFYTLVNLFCILLFAVLRNLSIHEKPFEERIDVNNIWSNKRLVFVVRAIIILFCVTSIIYVYFYNRLNFGYLWTSIYTTRAEYAAYASDIEGSLASYVNMLLTKTGAWFLLIGLYYSIMARKVFDTVLVLFTNLALFTVSMEKNTLMVMLVVFFIAWHEKRGKLSNFSSIVIKAFALFFAVTLVEYLVRGESILFTLMIRRVFYLPAYLTNVWYSFFNSTEKLWLTQDVLFVRSILSALLGSTQPAGAVKLISQNCFSGKIPSPNTGLFAEAYAQVGILGVFIFPFIYGGIIKLIRETAKWYGEGVVLVLFGNLTNFLLNVQALTSVSLVGIIMFFLITYLLVKKRRWKNSDIVNYRTQGDN